MDHVIGAVVGIVLLLLGIAAFPIALSLQPPFAPAVFLLGILLLSAALPAPIAILDLLDGGAPERGR